VEQIPDETLAQYLPPDIPVLLDNARKAAAAGDAFGLLLTMDSTVRMSFVACEAFWLQERGIYEEALAEAYQSTRVNFHHWSLDELEDLFYDTIPDKLLAAGDPLPPGDTFTLYRGVAGEGEERHEAGMSWTNSLDMAIWFATRFSMLNLTDPAVYETTVPRSAVLVYFDEPEADFVFSTRDYRRLDVDLSEAIQRHREE
jgi:hypothetical protein